MRSDADRVSDILEAAAKIREHVTDSVDAFQGDEMLQVWVIHHLQVIGEAARGVSQPLKEFSGRAVAADRCAAKHPGA
jgi:uncharacterized protein with HEPN domain